MFLIRYIVVICFVTIAVNIYESSVAMADNSEIKGSLIANGKTIKFPYVYVYSKKKGFYDEADPTWSLLFVEHPIKERQLDDTIWDYAYLRIGITRTAEFSDAPELQVLSQDIRFSAETNGNVTGGNYPKLEISNAGPERFVGRVYHPELQKMFDHTFQYDLSFDLPLSDPFAPIGDPLPKGGGKPGAAYLAWVSAVHASDIEKMKSLVTAEQVPMFEDKGFPEQLKFLQLVTPTKVKILSGSSDGKTAILQVSATVEGQENSKGEITLILMENHWITTSTSW